MTAQPESAAWDERDEASGLAALNGRAPSGGDAFLMAALVVPADKDYLALARLTAMHVAVLVGLTVGKVTDFRLAVDEACSLLLRAPAVPGELELSFERLPSRLRVTVRGPAPIGGLEPEDIGWHMMRALVGDARMETVGETATLTLIEPLPDGA